jgi:protein involved in polysaccharide export with SLBB domain
MHLRLFWKRLGLSLFAVALVFTVCPVQSSAQQRGCSIEGGCVAPGEQDALPVRLPQLAEPKETPERETATPVNSFEGKEAPLPLNPSQRNRVELPVHPRTEFEQIVADTTGRALPSFGQSLFAQSPSTFAPADRVQVPADYMIGPDDELQIRIWGQLTADLRVSVDRSGQIYIPRVGQIQVAGVHYSGLEQHLRNEISKLFRNFSLTVNIGRIRAIQVFVVGQAQYPGTYTISSLSTVVNAIFASGGPSEHGSLRDVQVQRDGRTIAHLDFYELLVKGDKSRDVRLQSGDVLYYPVVGPLVAITGSVNVPAIYELKRDTPLAELLDIAGGLSTMADSSKVTVERTGERQERAVLEFPLDVQALALTLSNGDIVRVFSVVPRFGNAVTLRGNVVNSGRYPWKQGMRVRDLIPDAQSLLTRSYWINRAVVTDGRSTEYPVHDHRAKIQADPGVDKSGETVGAEERQDAKVEGADGRISGSGRGVVTSKTLTRDLHRVSPEINWSYAIVQRVNPTDLSTKLVQFDLRKAVLDGDPANNLELQPDDIITIFAQSDVAVPQSSRTRYVRIEGEVAHPGVYEVQGGELLRDMVVRAGGVTPDAYIYGTQLTRESARVEQQKGLDALALSVESEVRQATALAAARSTSGDDVQSLGARESSQKALIAELKNSKASGRVVLALMPSAGSIDDYPAIALEDNDQVVIPHRPATVSVVGMVYNAGSFVFRPRCKVADYLKLAGKGRPNADIHHAFVLHADGSVTSSTAVNGAFAGDKFSLLRVHPGDQIVVPSKIQTGSFIRGLRDWTQITSQLALTGAALAVIR